MNKMELQKNRKHKFFLKIRKSWFSFTILFALLAVISSFLIPEEMYPLVLLRFFLGSIFIIFLPGFAFIKAIYPNKKSFNNSVEKIGFFDLLALSICMSLILTALVGLLLNNTPWGVNLTPVVLSLFLITIVFSIFAKYQENG